VILFRLFDCCTYIVYSPPQKAAKMRHKKEAVYGSPLLLGNCGRAGPERLWLPLPGPAHAMAAADEWR
ncbi:MAG: hypothetical protein LUE21_00265, partial [Oscillospiraceae bacterium]|nr:hypothetical protein [Oscillospiraceae bacterium]